MGGITAGKGFDFQTRYAACHLPVWLLQQTFHQLFYEGTGDIDVRYEDSGQSSRVHLQVKDHDVAPGEFKTVVADFRRRDTDPPGVYKRFTLVCPSLSGRLRPVETGLARLRNAQPFYDDALSALAPTREEVVERIRAAGIRDAQEIEFVLSKVSFEVGHGDLHHDDRAVDLFVGRLLAHPDYSTMIRSMVQPAFAELLRGIQAKRGAVLQRADVEQILRSSINAVGPAARSIAIWIHNWTKETFDIPADYAVDWSGHFDRSSRRVPSETIWNTQLLPELQSVKSRILAERAERLIRFRGKCALSTGIALGATFPAVGGWAFVIPQPPAAEPWRSDARPATPYDLQVELIEGSKDGPDLVVGLNIRGDGREDIRRYIADVGSEPRMFAFFSPPSQGSQSIGGAGEALAFAQAVRERLGRLLKEHRLARTRIFFYGPFALAVFLGQQLTSVGEVQLFEYQDPGYVPSCTFRT
jgi:hypothetical protein